MASNQAQTVTMAVILTLTTSSQVKNVRLDHTYLCIETPHRCVQLVVAYNLLKCDLFFWLCDLRCDHYAHLRLALPL